MNVWKQPSFRSLYAVLACSGIGGGIGAFALVCLVYDASGSCRAMGNLVLCFSLPRILLGPFAGALGDRYDKRRLIQAAVLIQSVVTFCLPWARTSVSTCAAVVCLCAGSTLARNVVRAYVAESVDHKLLSHVNAALECGAPLWNILGTALGGIILSNLGLLAAVYVAAAVFALAAGMSWLLPSRFRPVQDLSGQNSPRPDRLGQGFRQLLGYGDHRRLVLLACLFCSLYSLPSALQLPFCHQVLRTPGISASSAFAALGVAAGLGTFGFGFLLSSVCRSLGLRDTLRLGALLGAIELGAYGVLPRFWLLVFVTAGTGFALRLIFVPLITFLQEATPASVVGRTLGAMDSLLQLVMALSAGVGGIAADLSNVKAMFVFSGASLFAATALTLLFPCIARVPHDQGPYPSGPVTPECHQ